MVFLGTGTSVGVPTLGCTCETCASDDPHDKRLRCAVCLRLPTGNLLIDTPPDLRTQLLRENIRRIDAVLYTHEHVDHLYGLDDLRVFPHYLGHPLPVYCEEHVEQRIRRAFDYAFAPEAAHYGGGVPQLRMHRLGLEPLELLSLPIQPIRLRHGRFKVLGFRFGNVAYCTDTNGMPDESMAALRGLDVLVLDALRTRPHVSHYSLDEALAVVQQLRPKRTLLTHISHEMGHAATSSGLPPGVELAYDGLVVPLT